MTVAGRMSRAFAAAAAPAGRRSRDFRGAKAFNGVMSFHPAKETAMTRHTHTIDWTRTIAAGTRHAHELRSRAIDEAFDRFAHWVRRAFRSPAGWRQPRRFA